MKMTSHIRAESLGKTELHRVTAKPVLARSPRDMRPPRAPRRPWQGQQMQQGASMAYQQGFTSGPST